MTAVPRRLIAGVQASLLAVAGLVVIAPAPAAQGTDVYPTDALVGPIRYTESGGTRDPVYGAPLLALSDPFAENPVTSDDTVVMTLTSATNPTGALWIRKTNAVFPAAGPTADDTLTLTDSSTTPVALASATWFNVTYGNSLDPTVIATNIAVSAAGTYVGTVTVYEGSVATMTSDSIVQQANINFVTAGRPTSMSVSDSSVGLVATPLDQRVVRVSVADAAGKPTQLTTADSITVTSSVTSVATALPAMLTAANFDDTSVQGVGAADVTVTGGSVVAASTVTLTPAGTLPSGGAKPQSVTVTTIPLSTRAPSSIEVTYPTDQIFLDTSSTDDTNDYDVNDQYVRGFLGRGVGADPVSGVIAYVSANSSNWVGLRALDTPDQIVTVPNGASEVPVVLRADSTGTVRITVSWANVSDGGKITVRTGSGSSARYAVVSVVDPTLTPRTVPSGRVLAERGQDLKFDVRLTDLFGNPYVGFKVSGRAIASGGRPMGPSSGASITDTSGEATITVPAPDDTYTGPARIVFSTALASGLPFPELSPPQVQALYSTTGDPTMLAVTQAQSTPGLIVADDTLTTYPHIFVPFSGTARFNSGTVGTWSTLTSSGAAQGSMASFTPTTSPPAQVTVTGPSGVFFTTQTSSAWNAGKKEVTVSSGTPVRVFATKTGTFPINFASGDLETTALIKVSTAPSGAYNVAISPAVQGIVVRGFGSADAYATDAFGNRIPSTTDDTGAVTLTAKGPVLLSGLAASLTLTTDVQGYGRVALIAGASPGEGTLTVVPAVGTRVPAWQPGYVRPSGFPAPTLQATAKVTVSAVTPTPTIAITGTRGTVKGRPGIIVDGIATNLDDSVALRAWIRLDGRQSFVASSTVIEIATDGTFLWERKTRKPADVYVSTESGGIRSNVVSIT